MKTRKELAAERQRRLAELRARQHEFAGSMDGLRRYKTEHARIVRETTPPASAPVDPKERDREVALAQKEAGHLLALSEFGVMGEVLMNVEADKAVVLPASPQNAQRLAALTPDERMTVAVAGYVGHCLLNDETPRLGAIVLGPDGRAFQAAARDKLVAEGIVEAGRQPLSEDVDEEFEAACERARRIIGRKGSETLRRTVGEIVGTSKWTASDETIARFGSELEAQRFGVASLPIDSESQIEDRAALEERALHEIDLAGDMRTVEEVYAEIAGQLAARLEVLERLPTVAREWVQAALPDDRVWLLPSVRYRAWQRRKQVYDRELERTGDANAALLAAHEAEDRDLRGLVVHAAAVNVQSKGRALFDNHYITVAADLSAPFEEEWGIGRFTTMIYPDGSGPGYLPDDKTDPKEWANDPKWDRFAHLLPDWFEATIPEPDPGTATKAEAQAIGRRELPRLFGRKGKKS